MKTHSSNNIALELKKVLLETFSARIVSFLYFGTRAFELHTDEYSDYDFMLVLDKYSHNDTTSLRNIVLNDKFRHVDLNINFLYLEDIEIRKKENFQIRSVQVDFYEYLYVAKALIGKNLFKENPLTIESSEFKENVDFKIQEYYSRCDKLFLQNKSNQNLYTKLTKYTRDMVRFILIREGVIKPRDMAKLSFERIFSLAEENKNFSKSTTNSFKKLLLPYENETDILKADSIRRAVYERYLLLFSSRTSE